MYEIIIIFIFFNIQQSSEICLCLHTFEDRVHNEEQFNLSVIKPINMN